MRESIVELTTKAYLVEAPGYSAEFVSTSSIIWSNRPKSKAALAQAIVFGAPPPTMFTRLSKPSM